MKRKSLLEKMDTKIVIPSAAMDDKIKMVEDKINTESSTVKTSMREISNKVRYLSKNVISDKEMEVLSKDLK